MHKLLVIAMAVLVTGCGDDASSEPCSHAGMTYARGDTFPAGDGCNYCTCTAQGVTCTEIGCTGDAGVDADPASCGASGGCPSGPACGAICCGPGERCESGACRCGASTACNDGDTCEAAGPIGGDACGAICCGGSGPCPQ